MTDGYWQRFLLVLAMRYWHWRDVWAGHDALLLADGAPLPPARLRVRVGRADPYYYRTNGPRIYARLKDLVGRHVGFDRFQSVLDWGCGCGRVTRVMIQDLPNAAIHGCDVDPDAIDWMQQSFPGAHFEVIHPEPPTPYADGQFDFIYGISVFTHLDEAMQYRWLAELARITRVGGTVAVSVNSNPTDASVSMQKRLAANGFADRAGDREVLFGHFLRRGYYRLTLHSREYIEREWSRYFHIVEYVPNGIGRQDLVILQRRA